METLTEILSGEAAPETPATTAPESPATDVKTTVSTDPAAPASSAGQATESKADGEPAVVTPETEEQARVRDEKGRFTKPEEVASLRTAMQEERRRRQDAERRLAESTAEPKKDVWEDPEAFIEEKVQAVRSETDARFYSLSERLSKEQHSDFDPTVNALLAECETDPSLGQLVFQQVRASNHPAEALYTYATNRREMKMVGGDLGKYRESISAPLKQQNAELAAENKRLKDQLENLSKVPSSLNGEPSASRTNVETEATGPEPLSEILKPRKRRA